MRGISERKLQIILIQNKAKRLVGDCSDFQIVFCAYQKGVVASLVPHLDYLSDIDLFRLSEWIDRDLRRYKYTNTTM